MVNFCSNCGASLGPGAATPEIYAPRTSKKAKGTTAPKKTRKATAYNLRYGKAMKRLSSKYQKKSGGWKKGGYRACVKAAHKAARR